MKTIVVIPTYNEASNICELTEQLLALPVPDLQVLIVDDNSPDGTGRLADELVGRHRPRVQVLHRPSKAGLRGACIAGLQYALKLSADRIIQMDGDFSHSPRYVPIMLEQAEAFDLVIGSRYVDGGETARNWELWRKLLSRFANSYARVVTRLAIHDTTTNFRCYRREALARLPLKDIRSQGYAYLIEMSCACREQGLSVQEIPIHFDERALGQSKMSLGIVFEAVWRVWQIRRRYPVASRGPR